MNKPQVSFVRGGASPVVAVEAIGVTTIREAPGGPAAGVGVYIDGTVYAVEFRVARQILGDLAKILKDARA
jgi:hypothetical protein